MSFEMWMNQFNEFMRNSGFPENQLMQYQEGGRYEWAVKNYFSSGVDAGDACTRELMGEL